MFCMCRMIRVAADERLASLRRAHVRQHGEQLLAVVLPAPQGSVVARIPRAAVPALEAALPARHTHQLKPPAAQAARAALRPLGGGSPERQTVQSRRHRSPHAARIAAASPPAQHRSDAAALGLRAKRFNRSIGAHRSSAWSARSVAHVLVSAHADATSQHCARACGALSSRSRARRAGGAHLHDASQQRQRQLSQRPRRGRLRARVCRTAV